jgi:hypothetical protein
VVITALMLLMETRLVMEERLMMVEKSRMEGRSVPTSPGL